MLCKKCGTPITENTGFCSQCGTAVAEVDSPPSAHSNGLSGWSPHYQDPEIIAAAKKKNKTAIGYAWALVLVFPLGFLIAALFIKTMPLAGGLIIGTILGIIMLVINRFYVKAQRNQIWEGVVIEKYERENPEDDDSDNDDIDYVLVVEKTDGHRHFMIYHNRREMYDYFQIGDRVRYHAALSTYEKYDKSNDRIIYCNVCSAENPISNDRCVRCNNLLFK